jgi:hypothetical protein
MADILSPNINLRNVDHLLMRFDELKELEVCPQDPGPIDSPLNLDIMRLKLSKL